MYSKKVPSIRPNLFTISQTKAVIRDKSGGRDDKGGIKNGENNVIGCKPIRKNSPFNQSKGAAYTNGIKVSHSFGGIPLKVCIVKKVGLNKNFSLRNFKEMS